MKRFSLSGYRQKTISGDSAKTTVPSSRSLSSTGQWLRKLSAAAIISLVFATPLWGETGAKERCAQITRDLMRYFEETATPISTNRCVMNPEAFEYLMEYADILRPDQGRGGQIYAPILDLTDPNPAFQLGRINVDRHGNIIPSADWKHFISGNTPWHNINADPELVRAWKARNGLAHINRNTTVTWNQMQGWLPPGEVVVALEDVRNVRGLRGTPGAPRIPSISGTPRAPGIRKVSGTVRGAVKNMGVAIAIELAARALTPEEFQRFWNYYDAIEGTVTGTVTPGTLTMDGIHSYNEALDREREEYIGAVQAILDSGGRLDRRVIERVRGYQEAKENRDWRAAMLRELQRCR